MVVEIIIGGLAAGLAWFYYRNLRFKSLIKAWEIGLVIAALIYVLFVLWGNAWEDLSLEVGGLFLYGVFVLLSRNFSPYFIALGWLLHVLWDILLHANGAHAYVPAWYPAVCLGFDVAIAVLLFLRILQQQKKIKT